MPAERYFHSGDLIQGATIELEGTEFHHLVNVMRAKEGDLLEMVNGRGGLAQALLVKLEKKKARARIETASLEPHPRFEIILIQAIPRMNRLDFILEKGTELGMTQLWLFPGDHSERKNLSEHQLERMASLTVAAMKQCGRLYLPQILLKPGISEWEKPHHPMLFGDVSPQAPKLSHVLAELAGKEIMMVIGPESGLSAKEEERLRSLNALGVKLHHNILRTDTAALAALAVISLYSTQ